MISGSFRIDNHSIFDVFFFTKCTYCIQITCIIYSMFTLGYIPHSMTLNSLEMFPTPLPALGLNVFVSLPRTGSFEVVTINFVSYYTNLLQTRTVTCWFMQILPKAYYSDNLTHIHFHFHNMTSVLSIAKRKMSKRNIAKMSKTSLVLNTIFQVSNEDPEYQCSRYNDFFKSDGTDRSLI